MADNWTEADSKAFLELSDIAVPARREQLEVLLSLVPAHEDERFAAVDVGCGDGRLAAALLERFPRCEVIGLDGSETMLQQARDRLAPYGERARLAQFDLASGDWVAELPDGVRCVLSSLALHHLDDGGKRRLFSMLHGRIGPGGALLIADIVAPSTDRARASFAAAWERLAREQSEALTGSTEAYEHAVAEGWHYFASPDAYPEETPSRLSDQLRWLGDAGFPTVDCFWMLAGHAIYGGYR